MDIDDGPDGFIDLEEWYVVLCFFAPSQTAPFHRSLFVEMKLTEIVPMFGLAIRHGYFEEVSAQDTGVAETSPAAIKALAALEYAEAHKAAAALEPTTLVPTRTNVKKISKRGL